MPHLFFQRQVEFASIVWPMRNRLQRIALSLAHMSSVDADACVEALCTSFPALTSVAIEQSRKARDPLGKVAASVHLVKNCQSLSLSRVREPEWLAGLQSLSLGRTRTWKTSDVVDVLAPMGQLRKLSLSEVEFGDDAASAVAFFKHHPFIQIGVFRRIVDRKSLLAAAVECKCRELQYVFDLQDDWTAEIDVAMRRALPQFRGPVCWSGKGMGKVENKESVDRNEWKVPEGGRVHAYEWLQLSHWHVPELADDGETVTGFWPNCPDLRVLQLSCSNPGNTYGLWFHFPYPHLRFLSIDMLVPEDRSAPGLAGVFLVDLAKQFSNLAVLHVTYLTVSEAVSIKHILEMQKWLKRVRDLRLTLDTIESDTVVRQQLPARFQLEATGQRSPSLIVSWHAGDMPMRAAQFVHDHVISF